MGFLKNTIQTGKDLNRALELAVPYLSVITSDSGGLAGYCNIYVIGGDGLAAVGARFLVRTWIADAAFSEPDAQVDFSVNHGEQMYEHEANADYTGISTATPKLRMAIEVDAPKTVWIMAELDGRIYSKSVAITA